MTAEYVCPNSDPVMSARQSADSVLPPLTPIEGLEPLRSVDDLLTDEQKAKLRADLAEIARLRRRAEAAAAHIVLGAQSDGLSDG